MKLAILLLMFMVSVIGCATNYPTAQEKARESALTPGMAKKFIYPGKTTQAEVLEIFGSPNLVTHKEGKEIWTYDKISQNISESQGFLTILLAGVSKENYTSSSKSIMLIVYFDEKELVTDYKLNSAKF